MAAKDKVSGCEQAVNIMPSSGLLPEEIYHIIEEAKRNSDADRTLREVVLHRNRLEGLFANTERSFTEFGWMLSDENQNNVRKAIIQGKGCLDSRNLDDIANTFAELKVAARMITEAMFNPANTSPPSDPSAMREPKALPEQSTP